MPKVTLSEDCAHQVSHPTQNRKLRPGESTDASEQWVRQHLPLVRAGLIEVGGSSKPEKATDDQCKAKTKSGSRCKRTATDGDYCSTHAAD